MDAKRIDQIDDVDQMTVPQPDPSAPHGPDPVISVVIAVHNGMPYVESAIRSIMSQTLREIEIIVIDDASTDETPEVLARLAAEDQRIRILTNEKNLKLANSLNRGLEMARAPLIARMDADDLSMPNRLAVQKAYMDAHPEVVMAGTSYRRIDAQGQVISVQRRNLNPVELRWWIRFSMPLLHPSIVLRKHDADGKALRYDPAFLVAQDFDLVTRAAEKGDIVSLPDVLVDWRFHETSISVAKLSQQLEAMEICAKRVQERDLTDTMRQELLPFMDIAFGRQKVTMRSAIRSIRAIRRVLAADIRAHPDQADNLRRQAVVLLNSRINIRGVGSVRFWALTLLVSPGFLLTGFDLWRERKAWRQKHAPA